MPIREYSAVDPKKSCPHCNAGFEFVVALAASTEKSCPECGNPVQRQISAPRVGGSSSGFDDRAKSAGFSKLKKLGHGEYEKKY